jgi:two-component system heavy metal sensor histidine kinase CusS
MFSARAAGRSSLAGQFTRSALGMSFVLALVLVACFAWLTWTLLVEQEHQVLDQRITTILPFLDAAEVDEIGLMHEIIENVTPPREIMLHVQSTVLSEDQETPGFSDNLPGLVETSPIPVDGRSIVKSPLGGAYLVYRDERILMHAPGGPTKVTIWAASNIALDLEYFRKYVIWTVALTALCFGGVGMVHQLIARNQLRPLKALTDETKSISPLNLDVMLTTEGLPSELFLLAEAHNLLLARLKETITSLSTYADNAAHELRGPVGRILSMAERTLAETPESPETRQHVHRLIEEAMDLRDLLNKVLFLARADSRMVRTDITSVDIGAVLAAIFEVFEPAAMDAGILLTIDAQPGLSWSADSTFLRQALANLVENALRHTPKGGRVTISARTVEDQLLIEVADTGTGIAPEDITHVFERFYQADTARSSSSGTGLGLAVVASLVRLLNGTVTAESRMHQGTTFSMQFGAI